MPGTAPIQEKKCSFLEKCGAISFLNYWHLLLPDPEHLLESWATWDVIPTKMKDDQRANDLAVEIDGVPQAKFRSLDNEFDAISDKYIGQHKPYIGENFGQSFKKQARTTFETAKKQDVKYITVLIVNLLKKL